MNDHEEIKVLLIEENHLAARRIEKALSKGTTRTCELEHVTTLEEGIEKLCVRNADVLLLSLGRNIDQKGWEALAKAQSAVPETPVMLLADNFEEEYVVEASGRGAQDCLALQKEGGIETSELLHRVNLAIERKRIEENLRKAEHEWSVVFDAMADFVSIHDKEYRILKVNRALAAHLGMDPEEAVGRHCYELLHCTTEPWSTCPHTVTIETKTASTREVSDPRTGVDLLVTTSPIFDESGNLIGSVHVAKDISKLKLAEKQLAQQNAVLKTANLDLSILNRVSSMLGSSVKIEDLFSQALDGIFGLGLFGIERMGGIFVVEEDRLKLVAHRGASKEFVDMHRDIRLGDCLCGAAAATGEVIISPDSEKDERHTISYPGMTSHGHVIIPLKVAEEVVGVLYTYTPPGFDISDRQVQLLQTTCGLLASAIQNSRLFEETRSLSLHDHLTGLANRNLMSTELEKDIARFKRSARPFSVIMMDLDRFKNFNDTYGHTAGDRLLVDISLIILAEIREVDVAVRFGGEEFLLILPDTGLEGAAELAERIRQQVADTDFYFGENQPPSSITVSAGVATCPESADVDMLIKLADDALYDAKDRGRDRVEKAAKD